MSNEQKEVAEKVWLRGAIYVILKSDLLDHLKVKEIMKMVEAYVAMIEEDSDVSEMSDIAKKTFGLGDDC